MACDTACCTRDDYIHITRQTTQLSVYRARHDQTQHTHHYYTQIEEGRERWRSRLERLQEECSGERKTAREDVSRLSDSAEGAEGAARRAAAATEEELTGLRASLSAEFAQVCLFVFLFSEEIN